MGKQEELQEIVIYDAPGRKIEVQVRTESLWLSLTQVAVLFGVNKPAISKHLKNIYASKELDKQVTVSKMETVQTEGGILQQSAFGEPAYPSIESKAAHLLYFIIKDHPFADGNKRIEAMKRWPYYEAIGSRNRASVSQTDAFCSVSRS